MKKPQKKKKKPEEKDSQPAKTVNLQTDDERSNDYGGLPPRDLKKNLGCG